MTVDAVYIPEMSVGQDFSLLKHFVYSKDKGQKIDIINLNKSTSRKIGRDTDI